jgi:hypothetical protein
LITATPSASPSGAPGVVPSSTGGGKRETGRALWAVIRKELRQNIAFAALVICIDVLFIVAMEWSASGDAVDRNILLSNSVASGIVVGCALAALCIGLLQPYSDRSFDLWAFLVHRPVSRSVLFAGRAAAGLILYGCIAGIPVLAIIVLAMTPYGQGMFLWRYALPPVADFVAGIPFYFAGLLAVDRRALLYGSRAVPIASAVGVAVFLLFSPWFWVAVLGSLIAAGIIAVACEGSMISHGYTLAAPWRGRAATLVTLVASFTVLLLPIGLGGRKASLAMHLQAFGNPMPVQTSYTLTSRVLLADGRIAVETEHLTRDPKARRPEDFQPQSVTYSDLEGHPLPDVKTESDAKTARHFRFQLSHLPRQLLPTYRDIQDLARAFDTDGPGPGYAGRWYWVDARHAFYVYKLKKNQQQYVVGLPELVGSMGASGFAAGTGRAEPFSADGFLRVDWPYVYTGKGIFRVDTEHLKLETVFTAPAGEPLLWAAQEEIGGNNVDLPLGCLYVLTERHLFRISNEGKILQTLPITHDLHKEALSVSYFPKQHLWVLQYTVPYEWTPSAFMEPWNPSDAERMNRANTWETYSDEGKLLSAHTFASVSEQTPRVEYSAPAVRWTKLHQSERAGGFFTAVANPVFEVAAGVARPLVAPYYDPYLPRTPVFYFVRTAQGAAVFGGTLLVCGVIAFMLGMAYRVKHRWGWVVLAIVCGPAALLSFVAFNRWPRRGRCPACGKPRPLEMAECPHCRQPWPAPGRTGTEIFA